MTAPPSTRWLAVPDRYDFAGTVASIGMGVHDPCARMVRGEFWWAVRTPDGPAALSLRRNGGGLLATGYGPGADWVLDQADGVAGLRDDVSCFAAVAQRHPLVAELARVHSGLRLPATGRVFHRALRAVFEQKVTGQQAYHAYAATVRRFHYAEADDGGSGGRPAPGPLPDLLLPPDPAAVAATPYWVFHRFGVEQRRADTVARVAQAAPRLEECPDAASLRQRLMSIQGVGEWTAAEVVRQAFGDPDVVSIGDYHIPHTVSWALAGQARAGARAGGPGQLSPADERLLQLLEPFRGHRGRVCQLLERAGYAPPRFGPRMPVRSFATF